MLVRVTVRKQSAAHSMKRKFYFWLVLFGGASILGVLSIASLRYCGRRKMEAERLELKNLILADMPFDALSSSLDRHARLIDDPDVAAELYLDDGRVAEKKYVSGSWVIYIYRSSPHIAFGELEFRKPSDRQSSISGLDLPSQEMDRK